MANSRSIALRIFAIEPEPVVIAGLCNWLGRLEDFVLVGHSPSVVSALASLLKMLPDVVLMDLEQSQTELVSDAGLQMVFEAAPFTKIILFTRLKIDAPPAGVAAVLSKTAPFNLVQETFRRIREVTHAALPDPLSNRERQILELVQKGQRTKEIAIFLNLSVRTVENHRQHIMDKMHVHSSIGLRWINSLNAVE
jgi:DNA-binding NarL/FixJ family response regulator